MFKGEACVGGHRDGEQLSLMLSESVLHELQ